MTDENDKTNDGKATPSNTSGSGPRAPLSLKPRTAGSVSTGTVRQSFSHGRTKTVVVETKRRVGAAPGGHQRPQGFDVARPTTPTPAPQAPRPASSSDGGLSQSEQEARRRAIELATAQQAERERAANEERARKDVAAREQA
uniref:translation initiation factor IF-2 associated domain-containing protein n=1 Tax=Brevundimonas sp. FT23042 TaxID=3393749 RepID=UPI003B588954